MMRIVVNRQSMLGPRTGIGHYTAELLRALQELAPPQEIQAYPTGYLWKFMKACAASGGNGPARRPAKLSLGRLARRAIAAPAVRGTVRAWLEPLEFRCFQTTCTRENYDLYHEPNILPMPCSCPTIATLHDLSGIVHPEWHPAGRVSKYHRHLERTLKQCVHFLTVSDYVREEIINVLGVAPERVTRVYNGIRTGLAPLSANEVAAGLKALDLPPTYLLHVGTLEPRKNLEMLLKAYCSLPAAIRARCPLLLVGKWGWNTAMLAALLDGEAKHNGVMHLGYLAEEHLRLLYNGARALVFPSLYEGFGLPPVEMLACGGAVLASTAGSLPEVVGGNGHLIDPRDVDGWRSAMQRVIVDDDWRQSLPLGGRAWAAQFTWRRCAEETMRVYRQAVCGAAFNAAPTP
jgi:glycosyltransferase involved in cell wall biosynthesis